MVLAYWRPAKASRGNANIVATMAAAVVFIKQRTVMVTFAIYFRLLVHCRRRRFLHFIQAGDQPDEAGVFVHSCAVRRAPLIASCRKIACIPKMIGQKSTGLGDRTS